MASPVKSDEILSACHAVEDGDRHALARILYSGVDVNIHLSRDRDTLLFLAIREDQTGIYIAMQTKE